MRKLPFALVALTTLAALAGCLGDDNPDGPASAYDFTGADATPPNDAHPAYNFATDSVLSTAEEAVTGWLKPAQRPLPTPISGLSEVVPTIDGISGADGIAVFGPLAFVGPRTGPLHVVDILDPAHPQVLSVTEGIPVRDAATILYPDGTLVLVSTAGAGNLTATDVSDPTAPVVLSVFDTPHGNHNLAIVPGTPIVYNSPSSGEYTDIVDYSDPADPVLVRSWHNGAGCHDITWYISQVESKYRGYCAGIEATQIWDITEIFAPRVIKAIPFPGVEHGIPQVGDGLPADSGTVYPLSISHLAMVNHDATVLIMGDETGGGGFNQCDFYTEDPLTGATVSGPIGNLWFYDIFSENDPVLVSHISPEAADNPADATGACTAHFGEVIEDTGFLAMAFYTSGVLLIDFNDLENPAIVDRYVPDGSDFWDVQYHQGYLFTGDIPNGMQVLTLA